MDVNITWLLQHLGDDNKSKFVIDRQAKSCHTPRRNDQVEEALEYFK
jgi:hypothetical protein